MKKDVVCNTSYRVILKEKHQHHKKICIVTKCCIHIYQNGVMSLIGHCPVHLSDHINAIIAIDLVYQTLATAKILLILQMQRSLHFSIVWNRTQQQHHFIVYCNRSDGCKCIGLAIQKQVSCLGISVYSSTFCGLCGLKCCYHV